MDLVIVVLEVRKGLTIAGLIKPRFKQVVEFSNNRPKRRLEESFINLLVDFYEFNNVQYAVVCYAAKTGLKNNFNM